MDLHLPAPAPPKPNKEKSKDIKALKSQKSSSTLQKKVKRLDNGSGTTKSSKLYSGLVSAQSFGSHNVSWKDIYGLSDVKNEFQEVIHYFKSGLKPIYNILLYGLPGCGKTKLAQAFANECGMRFHCMRAKDIIQTYYTSIGFLKERFACFKLTAPCVLFLDELDMLSNSIDASNYVGLELDKLKNDNVFVIGAIEHLDQLPTILLPPRLYRTICVPLPDDITRKQIFLANIIHYDIDTNSIDPNTIAKLTERFSGLDVINMCHNASKICVRQYRSQEKKNKQAVTQLATQTPGQPVIMPQPFINLSTKINMTHIQKAIQTGHKGLKNQEIAEFEIISHIFRKLREFLVDLKNLTLYKKLDQKGLVVIDKKQNELIDMLKTIQQTSSHKTENIQILINENFQAERNSAFQLEKLLKQILIDNKINSISDENKKKLMKKKPIEFLKEIERLKKKEANIIEEIIL